MLHRPHIQFESSKIIIIIIIIIVIIIIVIIIVIVIVIIPNTKCQNAKMPNTKIDQTYLHVFLLASSPENIQPILGTCISYISSNKYHIYNLISFIFICHNHMFRLVHVVFPWFKKKNDWKRPTNRSCLGLEGPDGFLEGWMAKGHQLCTQQQDHEGLAICGFNSANGA
jgi:hypothetical protein